MEATRVGKNDSQETDGRQRKDYRPEWKGSCQISLITANLVRQDLGNQEEVGQDQGRDWY